MTSDMPDRDELIEWIEAALEDQQIETQRVGDTINARVGEGRRASKANLGLEAILARLDRVEHPNDLDRLIVGYARGVYRVLSEPGFSKTLQSWDYRMCAARMMPSVEVDTFLLGVADTQEYTAWHMPLLREDDLIMVCFIELDQGIKVLSREQVEAWAASDERIQSAARSMLFHKTRERATLRPVEGSDVVKFVRVGDGYDASRLSVLPDVFFAELEERDWRFALPHQDLLLYVERPTPEALAELRQRAEDAFDEAEYPLTDLIFRSEHSRPIIVQ